MAPHLGSFLYLSLVARRSRVQYLLASYMVPVCSVRLLYDEYLYRCVLCINTLQDGQQCPELCCQDHREVHLALTPHSFQRSTAQD